MRPRRSRPEARATASDHREKASVGREAGIEQRLDQIETMLRDLLRTNDVNSKRLTALQAQLDHLAAKLRAV